MTQLHDHLPLNLEDYVLTGHESSGFSDGTDPDWLDTQNIGNGTVSTSTNLGGHISIETGTSNTGDGGRLNMGWIENGTEHVYAVRVVFAIPGSLDSDEATAFTRIRSSQDIYARYSDDELRVGSPVETVNLPERNYGSATCCDLVVDMSRERFDGIKVFASIGGHVSSSVGIDSLPSETEPQLLEFTTTNTSENREARVYWVEYATWRYI